MNSVRFFELFITTCLCEIFYVLFIGKPIKLAVQAKIDAFFLIYPQTYP